MQLLLVRITITELSNSILTSNNSIDLWLSHAPSTHSDKHDTCAMAAVTVGDISQEAIGDFWRQKTYIILKSPKGHELCIGGLY